MDIYTWTTPSSEQSTTVKNGTTAFQSNGNDHFYYDFGEVGDRCNQSRYISFWLYFQDADADILLQINTDEQGWENCPQTTWTYYVLDLVNDLNMSTTNNGINGFAFSSDDADVIYDSVYIY